MANINFTIPTNLAILGNLNVGGTLTVNSVAIPTAYPIGTVLPSAPSDGGTWLQMNGQVVNQSTYATLFSILGHQPEFVWSGTTPPFTPVGICYGVGVYVIVGTGGQVATSTNLTTWTTRTSNTSSNLNDIAYNATAGLFVAVGAGGTIITSPDGVTAWTVQTSGTAAPISTVTWVNDRFVAAAAGANILYSTSGTSWSLVQPQAGITYNHIIYNRSVWFLIGSGLISNGYAYSTNGTSYNYVAKPTTNSMEFLGYDGNGFYVSDVVTGQVYQSTDGSTWSLLPIVLASGQTTCQAITSSGTIVCANYSAGGGTFYTSDSFASIHQIAGPSTALGNPICPSVRAPSIQKFHLFLYPYYFSGSPFAGSATSSVSGKSFSSLKYVPAMSVNAAPYIYIRTYYNGFNFSIQSAGYLSWCADPYDPATQFQIPTQSAPSGSSLYIKAL